MTKSTAQAASELLRNNPGSPALSFSSGELPEPISMTSDLPISMTSDLPISMTSDPPPAAQAGRTVITDKEADIAALQRSFPDASRCTARRFLIARDFDRDPASSMLQAHLEWRRATLPIERTPEIEKVLASPRFRVLRRGTHPVTNTNFMRGEFLSGTSEQVLILAYIAFTEELLEAADECCAPDEWASCTCICSGGWPPMSFCRKLAAVLEPNYPERLGGTLIYPVPKVVAALVNGAISFLPRRTREKFALLSNEKQLCLKAGLKAEDLPEGFSDLEQSRERQRSRAATL